jgi:hypothetical protein
MVSRQQTRERDMKWAIFQEQGYCRVGGYLTEADADDDLWGRPDGCYVAAVCVCPDAVMTVPATDCPVCETTIEE